VQEVDVDGVDVALEYLQPVALMLGTQTVSALLGIMFGSKSGSGGGTERGPI
jgi:hypothetical protein